MFTKSCLCSLGAVGQRFIVLLQNHPNFEISVLGASERSAGKRYQDVVSWMLDNSTLLFFD